MDSIGVSRRGIGKDDQANRGVLGPNGTISAIPPNFPASIAGVKCSERPTGGLDEIADVSAHANGHSHEIVCPLTVSRGVEKGEINGAGDENGGKLEGSFGAVRVGKGVRPVRRGSAPCLLESNGGG